MIDLHCHSTCSDGSDPPERLCELAAETGLSALALTDHDTLDGIEPARQRAGELGTRLVPGCEISCSWSPGTLHVLCYFVEPGDGPLQEELLRLAADRAARNELMVSRLATLGLPITREEVEAEAGGQGIGRPHFAAVLVRNGAAASIQDAFDRFLGKGTPGYVSKARVHAPEILAMAKASGAVAVVAHPLSLGLEADSMAGALAELAGAGLGGLECHYARYDPDTRKELESLAGRLGLAVTGGSDYHGTYKPGLLLGTGLGDLDVPDALLDALEERRPG
jgi:predicted metal-dependent phosphoesterase TrpH